MGKYFGTDGFRGEANVSLTVEHAYKIGRFLGYYFGLKKGEKANIVIGKDTRLSSYMFEYSIVAGLTASGANAHLLHVTTTPSVAYITRVDELDCGIMISASHNPYTDNGIKLINSKGEKMSEEVIALIEEYLDGDTDLPFATGDKIGYTVDYINARNRYMGYLMGLAEYSFKGIRVGLDPANGSSWSLAKSIFEALGAEVYVVNAAPNGKNINIDCGSTNTKDLQKLVVENSLDVGFAFDGDADRCFAVDEKGNLLTGDHILYICGKYLKEKEKLTGNTVVTTIMSNLGLYKAFDSLSIEYEKTDVGDKNVYNAMVKNNYILGGEQSGHIIFSKASTTGDGLVTAIKLMEVMIAKKCTMSKCVEGLNIYPQVLKNVEVTDKEFVLNHKMVREVVEKVKKELENDGRILVRKSGTENLIRVMVEAQNMEMCEKYVDMVIEVIKSI